MSRVSFSSLVLCLGLVLVQESSLFAQFGFFYDEPNGGWSYFFTGDSAAGAPRRQNLPALDGTWRHENGSDEWDADGRGVGVGAAGGVSAANGILTIEDALTTASGNNNNRKIYFTHDLRSDGVSANNLLDTGVTLFFRARLTPPPGEINSGITNPDGSYLPNGYGIFSDGKGMFGIRQSNPSSIISFSLVRALEDFQPSGSPLTLGFPNSGLLMNKLNGDSPGANVDANEVGGVTNLLALDSTQWHEFWITIQANDPSPGNGTHTVRIYMDGGTTPAEFNVTAGTGSDVDATVTPNSTDYLALGCNNSLTVGAFDTDFFACKAGVYLPVVINPTAPVGIAQQPRSVTVNEGEVATFSITVTGAPPRSIQWQRGHGGGGYTNITGATNRSYTTSPTRPSDNGALFRAVAVNPLGSAGSAVATLGVIADVVSPTIAVAQTIDSFYDVYVTFSELVTPATANVSANYVLSPGPGIASASLLRDGRTVQLHLDGALSETNSYEIRVNGVRDRSVAANMVAPNSMMSFRASLVQPGYVRREIYSDIGGSAVPDLTNAPAFIAAPSWVSLSEAAETATNLTDNYGQRLSGFLLPPETGTYTFYLSSDDESQLWLGTNESPAGAVLVCSETSYNGSRMWTGDRTGGTRTNPSPSNGIASNIGTNVALMAGRRYYFSVFHKEGSGGDNLGFTWQLPSQVGPPTNGAPSAITGNVVAAVSPCVSVTFSPQLEDQSVLQNRTATLAPGVVLDRSNLVASHQWQRSDGVGGFTNIPNAISSSLTLGMITMADDASQFRLIVVVPGGAAVSAAATLTVVPDTEPPQPLHAASLDGRTIGICFDEQVDGASAAIAANYQINGGAVGVESAILQANGRSVQLILAAPVAGDFTVRISDVKDLVPSPMPSQVTLAGTVRGLTSTGIGAVALAGQHFTCENDVVEIVGGGTDIGGFNDQLHLVYASTQSDFDARVRVTSLRGASPLTKAVLIARESTNAGSRGLHLSVNPPAPARDQIEPGLRAATDGVTTSWGETFQPAAVPDVWLRISRAGDLFNGYRSTNGTDWVLLGQTVQSLTPTLAVGIGVTAHDNTLLATGTFSNFRIEAQMSVTLFGLQYSGGSFSGSFQSSPDTSYIVQYKNSLNDPQWSELTIISGDGSVKSFGDPSPPGAGRFYRLVLQ